MRILSALFLILPLGMYGQGNTLQATASAMPASNKVVIVVHGGAGTIVKSQMTPEKETAYTAAITFALKQGYAF